MNAKPQAVVRARITTAADAQTLVTAALDALDTLEPIVETETRILKAGQIREALTLTEAKTKAAADYLELIETLKGNAIALGRFRPPGLDLLKRRHQGFADSLALNAAVLSTARTVSESLIRELSSEIAGSINPQGYGARGHATSAYTARTQPLAISKTL